MISPAPAPRERTLNHIPLALPPAVSSHFSSQGRDVPGLSRRNALVSNERVTSWVARGILQRVATAPQRTAGPSPPRRCSAGPPATFQSPSGKQKVIYSQRTVTCADRRPAPHPPDGVGPTWHFAVHDNEHWPAYLVSLAASALLLCSTVLHGVAAHSAGPGCLGRATDRVP